MSKIMIQKLIIELNLSWLAKNFYIWVQTKALRLFL